MNMDYFRRVLPDNNPFYMLWLGFTVKWCPKSLMVYTGKSENKMDDDWGYPHFSKSPYDIPSNRIQAGVMGYLQMKSHRMVWLNRNI